MSNNLKKKLLTAGCGISQASFRPWPTWVKYPEMTHELHHVNIGGPASGNEFIAKNVIKNLKDVDCAIIMWTGYQKIDFLIESQNIVNEIKTYPTRNFVLDDKGQVIDHAPAWWPSSTSGENRIKDWVLENIYSDQQQLDQTLIHIAGVQRALERHGIDYHMFLGYKIPFDDAEVYGIDLNRFVTLEVMYDNYLASHWKSQYSTIKNNAMIPVAGWHWQFYKDHIYKIIDENFQRKDAKLDKIELAVQAITEKNYEQGIS